MTQDPQATVFGLAIGLVVGLPVGFFLADAKWPRNLVSLLQFVALLVWLIWVWSK